MNVCQQLYGAIVENLPEILALRDERRTKPDGSYVTDGDLFCQSLVAQAVREWASDCVLVSEEAEAPADVGRNVIFLDPIDGTENFTSGLPEWGVSVSIFREGVHVESMLALPELGRMLCTGSAAPKHTSRIRGLSSSLVAEDLARLVSGPEYRISGCATYNFYAVVTGSFESFENPRGAHCWDILAGLNLSLGHGLSVDVDGCPYRGEMLLPGRRYCFRVEAPPTSPYRRR